MTFPIGQTLSGELEKIQTPSGQFGISETLSHKLTWSHYVELLKIDEDLERQFYIKQSEQHRDENHMEMKRGVLVTIISERILRDDLIELIRECGSKGHTITSVVGDGSRGIRASDFEGRNVKIETIVNASVADAIVDRVSGQYLEDYAVIIYTSKVDVVRGAKYGL